MLVSSEALTTVSIHNIWFAVGGGGVLQDGGRYQSVRGAVWVTAAVNDDSDQSCQAGITCPAARSLGEIK